VSKCHYIWRTHCHFETGYSPPPPEEPYWSWHVTGLHLHLAGRARISPLLAHRLQRSPPGWPAVLCQPISGCQDCRLAGPHWSLSTFSTTANLPRRHQGPTQFTKARQSDVVKRSLLTPFILLTDDFLPLPDPGGRGCHQIHLWPITPLPLLECREGRTTFSLSTWPKCFIGGDLVPGINSGRAVRLSGNIFPREV
jgi:hypothetical protein